MVYHEEAAAGVVAALFFLGFVCSVASKIRTGFRLYLLLGVSTLCEFCYCCCSFVCFALFCWLAHLPSEAGCWQRCWLAPTGLHPVAVRVGLYFSMAVAVEETSV